MSIWEVKRNVDRVQWAFMPLVSVGPLQFGMHSDEVSAALDGAIAYVAEGTGTQLRAQQFTQLGVTAFYAESAGLTGVAVDARKGPQVSWRGRGLVGCVPSELEQWLLAHAQAQGLDVLYTPEGNPRVGDLGLILRVQRAGDILLSRPLFLVREWALEPWDYLPRLEWMSSVDFSS